MNLGRMVVRVLIGLAVIGAGGRALAGEKQEGGKEDKKGGVIVGVVTGKGPNFIEVKAAGEEVGRKYVPHWRGGLPAQGGGLDKKMLAQIKEVRIGSRVRLKWEYEERARVVELQVLQAPAGGKGEDGEKKKGDGKKREQEAGAEGKKGTVVGMLAAKTPTYIEVKAPGEEVARRFAFHFGGSEELKAALRETPVGSRVRIEWVYLERPRVLALEPLSQAGADVK